SYSEPRWSASQGSAVATERVTLYGVPIVAARTIGLGRVDPAEARAMFIQRALVEGDWTTRHHFFHDNRRLVARLGELEARARRRDLMVSDEVLARFYDERLPGSVVSARHFDSWWKQARRHEPGLLTFTEDLLLQASTSSLTGGDYPTTWRQGELTFAVSYRFEPGAPRDGVTIHVPVEVLNQVVDAGFDWLVPGLREDLVAALIRSLPKLVRRLVVPAQDHASAVLPRLRPGQGLLTDQLAVLLRERAGVVIGPGDWDWDRVPPHLRVTFAVEDALGRTLAEGRDLEALRDRAAPALARRVAAAGSSLERRGLTTWDLGDIPAQFQTPATAHQPAIHGYPALVDDGASVSLRVLPTRAEADAEHPVGVRRLLLLQTTAPWQRVLSTLTNAEKLALGHNPHGSVPALLQDCLDCAVDAIVAERAGSEVRTAADFAAALDAVRTHAASRVLQVVRAVEPVLALHLQVVRRLDTMTAPALAGLVADVRHQLGQLIRPGFVADTGADRLSDLTRYLTGVIHRLDRAPSALAKDARLADEVAQVEDAYADLLAALRPAQRGSAAVVDLAWLIEELRISYFAQTLGTARPVSVQRIGKAMATIRSAPPG
ncbi:MAG TPA: DUF3418 domain-containing protein, partial [Candidatus Lustribacter sp.]|nr:DUF3418 domain-containing protein [Candidatus Lustribacter sp.]